MVDRIPQRPLWPQDDEEQPADQPTAGQPPARWRDLAEEAIEEAMRSGAFDNLPGRGKPLNLVTNPYAPGTELAYQLLKNNEYTLPWISERVSLLARIQELRDEIASSWRWYRGEYQAGADDSRRLGLAQEWTLLMVGCEERVSNLNQDIATVNLKQPGHQLEILKLTLDRELGRAGARRALGQGDGD